MSNLTERLQRFIDESKPPKKPVALLTEERCLLRSIKTESERSTKGRLVNRCEFECNEDEQGVRMTVVLDGRHAMSVGRQIVKRFEGHKLVEEVFVRDTRRGAKVIIRPVRRKKK